MINRVELVTLMSEAMGRTIEAGEAAFKEWVQAAHINDPAIKEGLARMYANYNRYGFPGGNSLVLRAILGREPRSLKQYIYELTNR